MMLSFGQLQSESNMETPSTMNMMLSLLPFAVFIAILYFFLLRPLQRIGHGIERLADAIERKGG